MRAVVLTTVTLSFALAAAARADEPRPGDAMVAEYFRAETAKLREAAKKVDWKEQKTELRRQLAEMLGLDPMPERTPLNAVVTGSFEHDGIVVEKLHFQSRPGLYVTADLYRPKTQDGPLPAILYVCGHALVKKDGVSYGNKAGYHHHGAWFARNGYVCLVIDTLQLGEIEGIHHGTYRYDRWWWNSRGYTPAGVEAWNGIRALDYLQSRPEVDGQKIGMTGRSGGGAYTWYVAALDERVKVAVPVAGITDLRNHVVDGSVEGHCDCMFFVNTYRWDYPMLAALVAPRPLLISNTDKDTIFPLDGVVRTYEYVRDVYKLYGAQDRLGLQITEGPHKDTQELRIHAFVWFDRWLKGQERVISDPAEKVFDPEQLKVFASLPADEINTKIDETFVPTAPAPKVPEGTEEWAKLRDGWLAGLREKTFRGWQEGDGRVSLKLRGIQPARGLVVGRYELETGEPGVRLPLFVIERPGLKNPKAVRLHVLGEADWEPFAAAFGIGEGGPDDKAGSEAAERFAGLRERIKDSDESNVFLAPRGVGPTAWSADPKKRVQIRRRFMLLGQTLDGMRTLDVRRAVQALRASTPFKDLPIDLEASGDAAVPALYASLFEPGIAGVELTDLPASHRQGPDLLNVLRVLDLPQTVALAAERCPVVLHGDDPAAWSYPKAIAGRLGWGDDRLKFESK
jgi:dienelactone hydrolase